MAMRRRKKYDPVRARQNQIASVVGSVLCKMYLWGSSTTPMRSYGTANMHALLDRDGVRKAQSALFEVLLLPRTWHFWAMVVADIGYGKVEVETYCVDMEDAMLTDFTEHLETTIRSTYKGKGTIVSYAYLAAPNDDVDFDSSEERLMDYWLEQGLAEETALAEGEHKLTALDFAKTMIDDRLSIALPAKAPAKNMTPALVN